jgi:hypothetical protein
MLWRTTIWLGLLLVLLGIAGYAHGHFYHHASYTALIPAGFGLLLIILGWLAKNDKWRKHAMHGVAVVGLIGFIAPVVRLVRILFAGGQVSRVAVASQVLMAVLCAIVVVLCVRSFIVARRSRTATGPASSANQPAPPT